MSSITKEQLISYLKDEEDDYEEYTTMRKFKPFRDNITQGCYLENFKEVYDTLKLDWSKYEYTLDKYGFVLINWLGKEEIHKSLDPKYDYKDGTFVSEKPILYDCDDDDCDHENCGEYYTKPSNCCKDEMYLGSKTDKIDTRECFIIYVDQNKALQYLTLKIKSNCIFMDSDKCTNENKYDMMESWGTPCIVNTCLK